MHTPAVTSTDARALLYTFRRCPYAMRARWAIHAAGVTVDQIEVSLRDKPPAMLAASPKGTVPVLVLPDGHVIDQSLDIMLWALQQNDPEGWLTPERGSLADIRALIDACESDFKPHLDRYKYPNRYASEWVCLEAGANAASQERAFSDAHFNAATAFLACLADRLAASEDGARASRCFLLGQRPRLADFAIAPFVRQLARHDAERFTEAAPAAVAVWLAALLGRADFTAVMRKAAGPA